MFFKEKQGERNVGFYERSFQFKEKRQKRNGRERGRRGRREREREGREGKTTQDSGTDPKKEFVQPVGHPFATSRLEVIKSPPVDFKDFSSSL